MASYEIMVWKKLPVIFQGAYSILCSHGDWFKMLWFHVRRIGVVSPFDVSYLVGETDIGLSLVKYGLVCSCLRQGFYFLTV